MAKTLSEYYSINYTQCSIEYSFLGSWKGLAYSSHLTQLVAVPIELITLYLIIYKTPKPMHPVKFPLLVAHFWCSALDIGVGTFFTPYVFFPACAVFGVGLLNFVKAPISILIGLGIVVGVGTSPKLANALYRYPHMFQFIVSAMAVSLIFLFESRSSSIKTNKYRFTRRKTRIYYYSGIYLLHLQIIIFLFWSPGHSESAQLEILRFLPCPTREFFSEPVFVVLSDPFLTKVISLFVIPTLAIFDAIQITFYILCLIYHLYIAPPLSTSSRTRKLQRHFFIGILAQSGVPLAVFVVTYTVIVLAYIMDKLTQGMMNMSVVIFGIHGVAESFAIIMIHETYRKEVWKFFMSKKREEAPVEPAALSTLQSRINSVHCNSNSLE